MPFGGHLLDIGARKTLAPFRHIGLYLFRLNRPAYAMDAPPDASARGGPACTGTLTVAEAFDKKTRRDELPTAGMCHQDV